MLASSTSSSYRSFALIALALLSLVSSVRAEVKTKVVQYQAGDTMCEGFLAWDDANIDGAKRPGVIIVHEWWGLTDYPKMRAQELAKLGYIAFCADMYGKGKTTTDPKEAEKLMTETVSKPEVIKGRFDAAMNTLKAQDHVDGANVAAIGYCYGGGVSLAMAKMGADLKAVVSFHGALDTKMSPQKGAVKAKVLVCHGADDPMVSLDDVFNFEKQLREAGAIFEVNVYSGAVHAFTNPNVDKYNLPGAKYNANADKRSWEAMKTFLANAFAEAAK